MKTRRANLSREMLAAVNDEIARRLLDDVKNEVSMDINRVRGFIRSKDVKTLYHIEQSLGKVKEELGELEYTLSQ